jgi:hypothetical protein
MTDSAQAQLWLDAYVRAWETYDPAAIGDLFTEDAEYRWHPWDDDDHIARDVHRRLPAAARAR